jgi:hypothetical protein
MQPIEFPEHNVCMAKNQPEYQPLPAHCDPHDKYGRLTFGWKLDWRERVKLLITGELWHQVLTFQSPLQPQLLLVDKPALR